jgi:protoporphyrinogen oxidase
MRLLVIGGSDAGISAGLRARELDPTVEVSLLVADAFPKLLHLWAALLPVG